MLMFKRGKTRDLERHFPHHNWPIVLGLVVLLNTAYGIFTPSVYQFITTPARSESDTCKDEEDTERFWPGLASSETMYAWVLMAYSIPETASMIFAGITAEKVPYTLSLLFTSALYAIGGVIYGQATSVWMVIVARGLMGAAAAFADVTVSSYIGEMGTRMDDVRERQGKPKRKYALYIAYSFVMNCTFIITFGATSIMSQFKNLEPYRWPGWFLAAMSVLYAVVVVLGFSDPRPLGRLKGAIHCEGCTGLSLSLSLKSGWKIRLISYVFLISGGYMIGQTYAILTTLVSPVLSDQLGFSVEYTSHYFVGVSAAFILASFIQLLTKVLKLDNRFLFGIALLGILAGVVLMGDWQSIRDDPCFFPDNGTVTDCSNSSLQLAALCESQNSSSSSSSSSSSATTTCFWNPHSRVTDHYCNTCHPSCQSQDTAVDFYQFSIGVLLVSLSSPLGFVYVAAITSDITSVESQGTMLSLVIGSGALARAISPLWFVESYDLSGRHTYISMATTALALFLTLICLLILFKKLAPIQQITLEQSVLSRHASVNILAVMELSQSSSSSVPVEVEQETTHELDSVLPVLYDTPL